MGHCGDPSGEPPHKGDPFCSHITLWNLPHTDSLIFKTHAEPPHTDGPNLKTKPFIHIPHSQFTITIPVNSIPCIKDFYRAILKQNQTNVRYSQHAVYLPDFEKGLLTSIHAFLYYL
jgi:hypothetical protein